MSAWQKQPLFLHGGRQERSQKEWGWGVREKSHRGGRSSGSSQAGCTEKEKRRKNKIKLRKTKTKEKWLRGQRSPNVPERRFQPSGNKWRRETSFLAAELMRENEVRVCSCCQETGSSRDGRQSQQDTN